MLRDYKADQVQSPPLAIVQLNLLGQVEFANSYFQKICGIPLKRLAGCDWFAECLRDQDRAAMRALFHSANGAPLEETLHRCPVQSSDGALEYLDWRKEVIGTPNSEPVSILLIGTKVAGRPDHSKAIEPDRLLERLAEFVPGAIVQYQLNPEGTGQFNYASPGIWDIYELTPEDVKTSSRPVFERIHPDDQQRVYDSVLGSAENLTPWRIEYRVLLPEKGERWLLGNAKPEKTGSGAIISHGYISDITDLKSTQAELEGYRDYLEQIVDERTRELRQSQQKTAMSEAQLHMILETSTAGITILRHNPIRRIYTNPRFLEMFGARSLDEINSRDYRDTFVDDTDYQRAISGLARQDGIDRAIMQRRKLDGTSWWSLVDALAIDYYGEPAVIVWYYDISHQKAAEQELVQAEKMASLGGLVAGVAHEVNTPIGICVTAASLLDEMVKETSDLLHSQTLRQEDLEDFLKTAQQSSSLINANLGRAAALIQSFKQVAIDQTNEELRTFQVVEYVEEAVTSLSPELKKRAHSVAIQGPKNVRLSSYPGALFQVLTNLIMNSLTHAFEDGETGAITIDVAESDPDVLVTYSDNGKGVSEDVLTKIYEPFFTTNRRAGGSGLGLNIVYNLVTQKMGGSIEAQSAPGKGLTFKLKIPQTRK